MNRNAPLGEQPRATHLSDMESGRDAPAASRVRGGGVFVQSVGFRRVRNAALIAGVSAYALLAQLAVGDPAPNAANFSQSTAGAISTTVPDGICAMAASVTGGSGASSGTSAAITGGRGAGGAKIDARFRVLPGQAVTGAVAGGGVVSLANGGTSTGGTGTAAGGNGGTVAGTPFHRGGGGGGSSSISVASLKLIEAGGGGGGGGAHDATPTGDGGSGGFAGIGAGTVAVGVDGTVGFQAAGITVGGGQGGQAAAGGTGGVHSATPARNGAGGSGIGVGTGGAGGPDNGVDSGGGGGGGYTGGGGGAATQINAVTGGGGGGGSSFVRATSPTVAATAPSGISGSGTAQTGISAVNGADGAITIDWIPCVYQLTVTKSASPAPVNAGARTVWTVAVANNGPDPMTKGDTISLADTLPAGPIGSPAPTFRVLTIGTSGGSDANLASGAMTCTGVTVGSSMPASTTCSRPYSAPSAPGAPSGGVRGLNAGETLTITYEQIFANTASATTITNTASTVDRSSTSGTTDIIGVNANRSANASVSVLPYDLQVTKSPSSATVGAGQTVTWTINVTNNGPGNMQGPNETASNPLIVSDTAPVTNVSAPASFTSSGPAGACTYVANTITCPSGLANGQTQTFTFQQTVNGGAPGGAVVSNTANVTDFTAGDSNDSGSASFTVTPVSDLAVTKTNGVTSVNAGGTTSYTITVTNNGPSTATGATLSDPAVAGLTKTSVACSGTPGQCTGGTTPTIAQLQGGYALPALASGQTYQLTVNANVTALSGSVANTATIAPPSGTTDPTPGNDSATDTDTVTPIADLAVTKTNGVTSVNAGGTTSYTVTVTNNGPSTATSATLSDPAVAGLSKTSVACSGTPGQCTGATTPTIAQLQSGYALPALASGQTYQLTVNANVTATSGSVANTATIAPPSGTTDPTTGNDSATDSDTVTPVADLAVTKTNGATSVNAGGTTSYTITVTNNGPSTATGATLTDAAASGLSKTSVACSGTPGQCTGGATPTIAQLEAGYALPALASGQTYQITVAANVTALSGSVANTATIAPPSGTTDPTPGNDSATDTDTVTPIADLAVTKTDGVASVNAGGTTTYTITVTNNGPSTATGATLTDAAVAGLSKTSVACSGTPGQCTAGTTPTIAQLQSGYALPALASGQSYQITVAANVTALSGSVANTATIAPPSGTTDPTPGNDSATDTDTVTPVADLAVTKTNGVASVNAGGTTSYTVTVTNNGSSTATGATLTDPAASGLTVTSVACSATPGQCTAGTTPTIAQLQSGYALPALASGQTYQLTVNANVTATSGSVSNTATIAPPSGTTDPTPGNDSATDTDTVTPVAELAVTKSDGVTSVNAGGTTTYTITVTNGGPSSATGATLTDPVASGLTVTSVACSATPGQCTAGTTPTIAQLQSGYALPALASGQTYQITVAANVTALSGSVANTATIAPPSGTTDPTPGNDSATDTDTVTLVADLAVTKANGVTSVNAGGSTTYTITVTNNGPSTATGATLSDPAVAGLSKTSIACSGTPGQCTAGTTPTIAQLQSGYALPALASGQTYQLTVNANVTATSGSVSNTASIAPPSGTIDPTPGNDSATDTDTVTPVADLAVTKTNGASSVSAGGTTSYTVTVTNNGPSTATGATLTDPSAAGLTVTSVACSATPGQCTAGTTPTIVQLQSGYALPALVSGQTYQLTVTANVTATSGSVANTASITPPSGTIDPTPGNDSATDTDTVTPVADLAVTKTDGVASVNAGGTTSYTVTVTNGGPSSVTGATLTDPSVAGLTVTSVACSATPGQCTAGTTPTIAQLQSGYGLPALASGQTYQLTVNATVTATSGSVSNTATIAPPSGTTDPTPGNDSATDTDTVTPVADLAVTKTNGVTSVNAGGATTYTITVTNGGPSSVTGATLTDPSAAGLTVTSVACSATPGQCTAGTTPTIAQLQSGYGLPALASGQTYQLTVNATVTATSGSVSNTATIAPPSGTIDPTPGNDSATDTDTVTPVSDLAVTKTNGVSSVNAGGTTSYIITVTNNGPSTATGATLSDPAAAGLTVTSVACSATPGQCTAGTTPTIAQLQGGYALPALASGQTYQLTVTANVTATSGSVSNTATITPPSGTIDPTPGNDSAIDTDTVTPVADLAVTKSDGVASVNAGGTTTYTITVTNNGPSTATGATLTDAAAGGLSKTSIACSGTPGQCTAGTTPTIAQLEAGYALPALASGQTYQITVAANVTALSGSVANTATIAPPSGATDPTPGNDSATDTDTVTPVADLAVTKTNGVTSVNAGGTTTYTITVTNNGPSTATGATLTDAAASGLSKTSVVCSGTPGQCTGGTTPTVAQLEAGYALPALASGQTYQITVAANVTALSGSVANTATIAPPSGTTDPTPSNDSATDTDTVTPVADLAVTKTNGVSSVNAGGTTSYTVTVTNNGPSTAIGATLSDPAAAGLTVTSVVCSATPGQCTAGTTPTIAQLQGGYALPALASGQTYQLTVNANVTATSGSVSNTASITPPSGTVDPTPGNDSATDTDTVTPVADLAVAKTNGVSSVNAGGTTSYTITITNNGPSSAIGATLTDPAATGLTVTSVVCSATPGQCTAGTTPTIVQLQGGYALPALASGQTYQLTVNANVTATSGSVSNTATITPPSGTIDPTPGNDSATDTDTVTPVADLAITKTNSTSSVNAGGTTTYTLTVTNNGPSSATGATLTDPSVAGLTITSVACSATPGQCTAGTTPTIAQLQGGYALPALASGQTYQLTISANVTATSGSVSNTATIAPPSGTIDPTPGNDGATDTDTVTPVADLAVTKTNGGSSVNAGGTTTYTITVTNNGPSSAAGATLADPAASGLTVTSVACSATPGQCTAGTTPTIAQLQSGYGLPALASGQTYQLTVNAAVTATSGSVSNTATVAPPSGTIDPTPGNDSATDTDTVTPVADLAVTKTNGVTSVNAGGTTSYTITVTNNGPSTVTGATLSDPVASGLTIASVACSATPGLCTAGTTPTIAQLQSGYALPALASGQTYQIVVTANVTATSGSVSNTATIAPPSGTIDPTSGNDSATDTDSVTPVSDLAVTKTNGVASVDAGGTTNYTLTVTNNGPSSTTGATLSDPAAAGLTVTSVACSATPGQCTAGTTPTIVQLQSGYALPALASGQTYQLTVAANVTATSGSVSNTATIAPPSGTIDPTPGNDGATDTDTVTPVADLAVTKTNGVTSVNAGGTTSYTITVTNGGPSSATGATLSDPVASGLTVTSVACSATPGQCTAGTTPTIAQLQSGYALPALAGGQTYQLTVAANVTATSGSVSNTATVAPPSGTIDPTPGNDSATDTDTVTPVADLAVAKTNGVTSVNAGGTTTYTITVTNGGPSSVTGATLTDPSVAGLTVTSVACSATPGQCTAGTTPTIAQLQGGYALPALASGQTYELTVSANVTASSGSVANTASIAPPSGTTDPTPGNDSATDTDTVNPVANLVTVKTRTSPSATPAVGDTVTFQIAVTNNGPSAATNVSLTDALPAGLTPTGGNGTVSQGSYSAGSGVWTVGSLSNGATATLTLSGAVNAGQGGQTITNTTTAAATPDQPDPTTSGDDLTESVNVFLPPIVALDDSVGGVNGASGAANVVNAFTGDTLNGVAATAANTTLVVASGSSVPAGLTFNTATGNVSVAAGVAAGTYTFDYTICEIANPANCDTGTISVTVAAAAIVAVDDSVGGVNGASGATNVLNAFTGDTLNGGPATAANSTLTVASGSSVPAGLTFDPSTGNVSVAAGVTAGIYSFNYTICEILNPANCDDGAISVTVVAAPIVANNDTPPAVISGVGAANLINAFTNDTLNGAPVNIAAITASVTGPASNPGVSLDVSTGVVSVAAGVPAGDYTIQYQICEALNPANCSSATIAVHVDPAVSAVTGTVYTDANGNAALDMGDTRQPNWIVEIFRNGTLVGTTTTNGTGDYLFTGLLSGPGYSIQFRNPENNVVFSVISNLTLADNVTVVDQNLPIDPSGVVYDSLTRSPVAGAVLTLVDSGGAPLPAACFVSATQQGQQTGASGQYKFDIQAGAAAQCPLGETVYRIVVTPPGGYSSPSTVLTPQAGPFDPTGMSDPALVVASANPPAVGDPAVYYLTLRLASGDPDVIFNHIPIDPFQNRPPLTVTKTSIKRTASVGDLVPYTITVRNTEAVQRAGVTVVDILPPGFKYVPGSASVNGVAAEPAIADRELTWTNQIIPANGAVVYRITLVVGAGVTGGDRTNTGLARNGADNSEISNRGQAVVAIVASTVFDCAEIIGKVFDDRNGDGYQTEGEPGIAAARLATVNGLLATTDEFGRYHITCVAVPNALIGSNFVLKLDPRSVPAGYAPTIDNPQSIRLTRGKMSELNFGVKKAEIRAVNLDARAFVANGPGLKPEFAAKLKVLAAGAPQALIVRVNYRLEAVEDTTLADARLAQLKRDIEACFGADWDDARPVVETNMSRADATAGGAQAP